MTPGHDLCGRFRLRELQQTRSDRTVWTANDLVTKRSVRVHVGSASLLAEVTTLQQIQGRGVLPYVGLWRDGRDVVLVFANRLPQASLAAVRDVDPVRCSHWLADLAAALLRLDHAGISLGVIDASRVWVSGDRAWLDPTGPHADVSSPRTDVAAVCKVIREAASSSPSPRGTRSLLTLLGHADLDRRPSSALDLRRVAERALNAPRRSVGSARRVVFAPRRTHQLLVHGRTGTWARVGEPIGGLRRLIRGRRARKLSLTFRWRRVSLGWTDVAVALAIAVVGTVVVPCVGGPIALFLAWQWRRARCRPSAGDALGFVEWGHEDAVASLGLAVEGELPPAPCDASADEHGPGA